MIGMAAFVGFVLAQPQLPQPKPASQSTVPSASSFVMPLPTTSSYYASALGPSKVVG